MTWGSRSGPPTSYTNRRLVTPTWGAAPARASSMASMSWESLTRASSTLVTSRRFLQHGVAELTDAIGGHVPRLPRGDVWWSSVWNILGRRLPRHRRQSRPPPEPWPNRCGGRTPGGRAHRSAALPGCERTRSSSSRVELGDDDCAVARLSRSSSASRCGTTYCGGPTNTASQTSSDRSRAEHVPADHRCLLGRPVRSRFSSMSPTATGSTSTSVAPRRADSASMPTAGAREQVGEPHPIHVGPQDVEQRLLGSVADGPGASDDGPARRRPPAVPAMTLMSAAVDLDPEATTGPGRGGQRATASGDRAPAPATSRPWVREPPPRGAGRTPPCTPEQRRRSTTAMAVAGGNQLLPAATFEFNQPARVGAERQR